MGKKKYNKNKLSIPRNVVFIGIILLTILTIFFTWFGVQYSSNHVKPFKTEIEEVENPTESGKVAYKVEKIKPKEFTDFTFKFFCYQFKADANNKVVFHATAYDKAPDIGRVDNINAKVVMAANWIGYTSNTDSKTIKNSTNWWNTNDHDASDEDDDDPFDKIKVVFSITSVKETFPQRSFFFGMKVMPKTYVYLTYDLVKNQKTTKKHFLIEYAEKDYFTNDTLMPN